jgi:hypothetical protein
MAKFCLKYIATVEELMTENASRTHSYEDNTTTSYSDKPAPDLRTWFLRDMRLVEWEWE